MRIKYFGDADCRDLQRALCHCRKSSMTLVTNQSLLDCHAYPCLILTFFLFLVFPSLGFCCFPSAFASKHVGLSCCFEADRAECVGFKTVDAAKPAEKELCRLTEGKWGTGRAFIAQEMRACRVSELPWSSLGLCVFHHHPARETGMCVSMEPDTSCSKSSIIHGKMYKQK